MTDEQAKFLRAECGVRYWEDARVNGVEDTDGTLIPCRVGDDWRPVIELATGKIIDWPTATTAEIHYKICDDGRYVLLSADQKELGERCGYVPPIMSPGGDGWGDYVIMSIGPDGVISDWSGDLSGFNADD